MHYTYLCSATFKSGSISGCNIPIDTNSPYFYLGFVPPVRNNRAHPVIPVSALKNGNVINTSKLNYAIIKWADEDKARCYFITDKAITENNTLELICEQDLTSTFADWIFNSVGLVTNASDNFYAYLPTSLPLNPVPAVDEILSVGNPFITNSGAYSNEGFVVVGTILNEEVNDTLQFATNTILGNTTAINHGTYDAIEGVTKYYAMDIDSYRYFMYFMYSLSASFAEVDIKKLEVVMSSIVSAKYFPLSAGEQSIHQGRMHITTSQYIVSDNGQLNNLKNGVNNPTHVTCKYDSTTNIVDFSGTATGTEKNVYIEDSSGMVYLLDNDSFVIPDWQNLVLHTNELKLFNDIFNLGHSISLKIKRVSPGNIPSTLVSLESYSPGLREISGVFVSSAVLDQIKHPFSDYNKSFSIEPVNNVDILYGPFGTITLPLTECVEHDRLDYTMTFDIITGDASLSIYGVDLNSNDVEVSRNPIILNIAGTIGFDLSMPRFDSEYLSMSAAFQSIASVGTGLFSSIAGAKAAQRSAMTTIQDSIATEKDKLEVLQERRSTNINKKKIEQTEKRIAELSDTNVELQPGEHSSLLASATYNAFMNIPMFNGTTVSGSPFNNNTLAIAENHIYLRHRAYKPFNYDVPNNNVYPTMRSCKLGDEFQSALITCPYISKYADSTLVPNKSEKDSLESILEAGVRLNGDPDFRRELCDLSDFTVVTIANGLRTSSYFNDSSAIIQVYIAGDTNHGSKVLVIPSGDVVSGHVPPSHYILVPKKTECTITIRPDSGYDNTYKLTESLDGSTWTAYNSDRSGNSYITIPATNTSDNIVILAAEQPIIDNLAPKQFFPPATCNSIIKLFPFIELDASFDSGVKTKLGIWVNAGIATTASLYDDAYSMYVLTHSNAHYISVNSNAQGYIGMPAINSLNILKGVEVLASSLAYDVKYTIHSLDPGYTYGIMLCDPSNEYTCTIHDDLIMQYNDLQGHLLAKNTAVLINNDQYANVIFDKTVTVVNGSNTSTYQPYTTVSLDYTAAALAIYAGANPVIPPTPDPEPDQEETTYNIGSGVTLVFYPSSESDDNGYTVVGPASVSIDPDEYEIAAVNADVVVTSQSDTDSYTVDTPILTADYAGLTVSVELEVPEPVPVTFTVTSSSGYPIGRVTASDLITPGTYIYAGTQTMNVGDTILIQAANDRNWYAQVYNSSNEVITTVYAPGTLTITADIANIIYDW